MKKILVVVLFAVSCSDKQNNYDNPKQKYFTDFLGGSCKEYNKQSNEIQKGEYFRGFQSRLSKVSDSIGVFKNWEGIVSRINSTNSDNYTSLSVEIKILSSNGRAIYLSCNKFFKNDNIDSNLIYRQLKNIKEGESIYFDGFLQKNKDNFVTYETMSSVIESYKICSPTFNFYLISASKEELTFTSNEIFSKVTDIQTQIWKLMEQRVNNKISQKDFSDKLDDYKSILEPITVKLSRDEKDYVQSFTDCLNEQFQEK